jgi:misacylated tRNA(Ala) deacylase
MTLELYLNDSYLRASEATVTGVDERGIRLDRTPFYAAGGGQPGDRGVLRTGGGAEIPIAAAVRDRTTREVLHVPAEGAAFTLSPGDRVSAEIDWDLRYRHMRTHTCLHLLCSLLPYPVTGGSVRAGSGRLDFDIPEPIVDKDALTAQLNALIARNAPVRVQSISEAELRASPELVRTLEVGPPVVDGRVRVIDIEGIDRQPCGGSHLRATGEIGPARVARIEKKGRINRRIEIALDAPPA